jgi:hypothetical protein
MQPFVLEPRSGGAGIRRSGRATDLVAASGGL